MPCLLAAEGGACTSCPACPTRGVPPQGGACRLLVLHTAWLDLTLTREGLGNRERAERAPAVFRHETKHARRQ